MSNNRQSYHHGDLKQVLLEEATDIIRESGIAGLSMRKLAEKANVSRTAPYHHFKDKNELLCAIAENGFSLQEEATRSFTEQDFSCSKDAFRTYVIAYLKFANTQPETYDLMFGRDIWKAGQPTDSLRVVSKQSFKSWVDWITHLQEQGVFKQDEPAIRVAQASWAALHGLCRLFNDGIYVNRKELEEIAETSINMMMKD